MKRILVCMACVWLSAVLIFAGRSFITHAAANVTPVCGTLSIDTTWTASNSPYEVCVGGVTVAQAATLTIEPGVTVRFLSDTRLTVSGILDAMGTPTQQITFTGVITSPGSWRGILGQGIGNTPAQVSLDYVTLEYGGLSGYYGAQLYSDLAHLKVSHSLIRDGAGSGIFHEGDADLSVHDTRFVDNANDALRIDSAARGPDLGGLAASGNGRDMVFITSSSYLRGQRHWPAPGLPYILDGLLGNLPGDSLTIDPGNELQFSSSSYLNIGGELKAIGLPTAPITLTGLVKTPGSWIGLVVYGGNTPANAQLDHVTIEYGGRNLHGANIGVTDGYLLARNSIIRYSQYDGVRYNSQGTGSLVNSQVVDNGDYGVRNTQTTRPVLATNNWWGDPSGPASDLVFCGAGTGDRVSAGVLFRPVLTDTVMAAEFPLSEYPNLALIPRRWFAPADGKTRVYFDITVRDGNGAPLPGRTIRISSSLGNATDGGTTDANGHTLAYLVSGVAGDAEVTAVLDPSTACEGSPSPTSKVTFTAPVDITELLPGSPAPYFSGRLTVTPLPVEVGVPSHMQATLTNPLTVPITVDVAFNFVQSSIGLAFGPVKEFTGQVIPANGSVTLSADWLPLVSGHYCVEVNYTITSLGAARLKKPQQSSGRQQLNLSVQPGSIAQTLHKAWIDLMDQSYTRLSAEWDETWAFNIRSGAILLWKLGTSAIMRDGQTWVDDPPRQDYDQVTLPEQYPYLLVEPDASTSPARAAAINAVSAALVDVFSFEHAAVIALDRYGGACEAYQQEWAAQQANAHIFYQKQMGEALKRYATALESLRQVLIDEAETQLEVTPASVIAYQQRLIAQGFNAEEIAQAEVFGMTSADLENYRQQILAVDPYEAAGNVLNILADTATTTRLTGEALLSSDTYRPHIQVGGSPGLGAAGNLRDAEGLVLATTGNSMAQIHNVVMTFQLGNPLAQSAQVDLISRRIDLPADWTVSVSPDQVSLAPGEQTTVTVSVLTGSLVAQNTFPRVAVEGYAGDQLLGGIVFDIFVPRYTLFDGKLRLYLPAVQK